MGSTVPDRQWESFEEGAAEWNKGTSHGTLDREQAVCLTSVEASNSPLWWGLKELICIECLEQCLASINANCFSFLNIKYLPGASVRARCKELRVAWRPSPLQGVHFRLWCSDSQSILVYRSSAPYSLAFLFSGPLPKRIHLDRCGDWTRNAHFL